MCGTFTLAKPIDEITRALKVKYAGPELPLRFNARPSQSLPVILNSQPNELVLARWGFEPGWGEGRDIINARQETLAERPMFRESFELRRCLVPADGFYEWENMDGKKLPHLYTLKNEALFNFAGLWRSYKNKQGQPINEFVIITTTPNDLVAKVHDRMPVILTPGRELDWLDYHGNRMIFNPLKSVFFDEQIINHKITGN